jgi:hypothetical protein
VVEEESMLVGEVELAMELKIDIIGDIVLLLQMQME